MLDIIRGTVQRYGMLRQGDCVIAGLSGGADSVALLHALQVLSQEYGIALRAVHVNHCIRGGEADRDQHCCEQLCARIVAKEFLPNQRLMSVREVALAAGVNPNTVQRAFEQLEGQGVLRSERGSGWFVTEDIGCAQALYREMVQQKCRQFFLELQDLGMSPDAVKNLVKEWENE